MEGYNSRYTGEEVDERLALVIQLQNALTQMETSLASKYSKPADGIPETDLDASVQTALALALTTAQSLSGYYTKAQVDAIAAAIAASVDSTSGVVVATLPSAGAGTLGKIYYVGPDASGFYDRYVTFSDGSTYSWLPLGNTEVDMTQYATKEELNQLGEQVTILEGAFVMPPANLWGDLSTATARPNSSADISWSVANNVLTMSTTVNTNQHLYINLPALVAGKVYQLTLTADNLSQALNLFTGSSYAAMTKDGTTYTIEFTAAAENYLDFSIRNRTNNVSNVVLKEKSASPIIKESAVQNMSLDIFTPEAKNEITLFDRVFEPTSEALTPTAHTGEYIRNDGVVASSTGHSYTDPIFLKAGNIIELYSTNDLAAVAMVSETDSEAAYYVPLILGNEGHNYRFMADHDMYVALSYRTSDHSITKIFSDVLSQLTARDQDMSAFFLDIIGKYTALGDSFTAGHIFNSSSPAPDGYAYTDFTFPTIIGRKANAETDIAAFGGATSKSLYAAVAELIDYENTNFYTIWLGTNDGYTEAAYEDIDVAGGWQNYPNTFVGAYCKLLDRILEESPDAIVVLINVNAGATSGDSGCTLASTKTVIRRIAAERGLLCIETEDYTRTLRPSWHGMNGGNPHWSVFGYENLAKIFMSEVGAYLYAHPAIVEKIYRTKLATYNGVNRIGV